MCGHADAAVQRFLELATPIFKDQLKALRPVATPCMDDSQFTGEQLTNGGKLGPVAARIVLKALYLATNGRPDIYFAVNTLARKVHKWSEADDIKLHRLICYLQFSKDWVGTSFVGDAPQDLYLALFCDAGFAGDLIDSKSTSGAYIALVGPNTFAPITWMCKKQQAVSHSTTEAEIIAMDAALRLEGLALLMLLDVIKHVFSSGRVAGLAPRGHHDEVHPLDYVPPNFALGIPHVSKLLIFEDNEAVVHQTIKGRSPVLMHCGRTHRVNLDWLFERIKKDPGVKVRCCPTKKMIADIFTKGSFNKDAWVNLLDLAQIGKSSEPLAIIEKGPEIPQMETKRKRRKIATPFQSEVLPLPGG